MKHTKACLASLFDSMPNGWEPGRDYEVIVYDDASSDATGALLDLYDGRVRTITGDGSGWYAINNNRMASAAHGRWLCMLNNDTLLSPGWIEPMLELGGRYERTGVVGNVHVFGDRRTINHTGVVFHTGELPGHLYEGLDIDTPGAVCDRVLQAATAACWMTPRALFAELDGFDEGYVNGFEDIDYCLRAGEREWSVRVAGSSMIVHFGSSSPGRFDREAPNRRRFVGRWSGRVDLDATRIAAADGLVWPTSRSLAYRLARGVWRTPGVRATLRVGLKTQLGTRLRRSAYQILARPARGGPNESRPRKT